MVKNLESLSKIKVGVSSCLLGEMVRWNGEHKKNNFIKQQLSQYFEWELVCPEVEVGMGVPREPVHLRGTVEAPRMVGSKSKTDWTDAMNRYAQKKSKVLKERKLSGFIFKKDSPSCGVYRISVFDEKNSMPNKKGRGLFATEFIKQNPYLPVEEEGRLNDAVIRENFITRVFCYHRVSQLMEDFSHGKLVEFHTRHKYLIMVHSQKHYKEIGVLVANCRNYTVHDLKQKYQQLFLEAFLFRVTTKKNVNVLLHILGYFKKELSKNEKKDILSVIEDYQNNLIPLIVPITLFAHYVNKFEVTYLQKQVYLEPNPKNLMLRNYT